MNFDVGSFFIGFSTVIALYILYCVLVSFYNLFFIYFFRPPTDLHKKAGAKWAVVTGSTDGIGRAYAFELARKDFNVVLISRTQSKLDNTRREILQKYSNIEVETFAFDLSTGSSDDYKPLIKYLESKSIGILINNVGGHPDWPRNLHETLGGIEAIAQTININILPMTILSAAVLPQMVTRKSGIIVNVASGASYFKLKKWSLYCSSKKFVSWFTEILQKEYESSGVTIQLLCPFLIPTKLSHTENASFFAPAPADYAKRSLEVVGATRSTSGILPHQIQTEIIRRLPSFILEIGIGERYKKLEDESKKK